MSFKRTPYAEINELIVTAILLRTEAYRTVLGMVYPSSALAQLRHIALLTLYSTAAIRGGGFARQWRIGTPSGNLLY